MKQFFDWQPIGILYSVQLQNHQKQWRSIGNSATICTDDFGNFFFYKG